MEEETAHSAPHTTHLSDATEISATGEPIKEPQNETTCKQVAKKELSSAKLSQVKSKEVTSGLNSFKKSS